MKSTLIILISSPLLTRRPKQTEVIYRDMELPTNRIIVHLSPIC